jgi:hypothetical protein
MKFPSSAQRQQNHSTAQLLYIHSCGKGTSTDVPTVGSHATAVYRCTKAVQLYVLRSVPCTTVRARTCAWYPVRTPTSQAAAGRPARGTAHSEADAALALVVRTLAAAAARVTRVIYIYLKWV